MTCKTIGLFGGTFDPVHMGHLRMALELKQHLALDEMRLVPCHIPPHREQPVAGARQRAAMVEAAVAHCPDLSVDYCELDNPEPSYSVHTLRLQREALGEDVALCLAMGMDSLASLSSWYQWREILQLAHIVVAARPGWHPPDSGELAETIQRHQGRREDLQTRSRGVMVIETLRLLPISSTDIRRQIASGESPRFLVPEAVLQYLTDSQLYQSTV